MWVTFTIATDQDIEIYLEPGNSRDVMIHLYDSTVPCSGDPSGSEIACEDSNGWASGAAGSETLIYNSLSAGTYYIRVQAYNSNYLNNSSFICVTQYAPPICPGGDDPCSPLTATVSTTGCDQPLNVELTSACSNSGGSGGCNYNSSYDDIWVEFTTISDMDLTAYFEPQGASADAVINLYDGNGSCDVNLFTEIGCSDNTWWGTGSSYAEQIDISGLPAGTYYLRIQEYYNGGFNASSFVCIYGTPLLTCQTIDPSISSMPAESGGFVNVCQGTTVDFTASVNYPDNETSYTQDNSTSTFVWDFGGGNIQSGTNLTNVSYTFNDEGGHNIELTVTDVMGCSHIYYVGVPVQVSLTPDFSGTSADQTICYGDIVTMDLDGQVSPWTSWMESCNNIAADTLLLPDGVGTSYESSIWLDCYSPGQTLDDISHLWGVCAVLEHSWLGDLEIEIECPTGQTAILKDFPGGGGTFLGEPVSVGSPDGDSGNTMAGNGYFYCWDPTPAMGTMTSEAGNYQYSYTDNNGNVHTNQNYLPSSSYASDEPLTQLLGCELNGEWKMTITDNLALDNGYAFNFAVQLDPGIAPLPWNFQNNVVSEGWAADPTIISTVGNTITVQPASPGVFPYYFEATDDFGCTFDTVVTVTAVAPPNAGSGATVNACLGSGGLDLFAQLTGSPDANGSWNDDDGTGALNGSTFDVSAVGVGTYNFTYTVTAITPCSDDTAVVTVIVGDVTPPVISSCAANVTVNQDPDSCVATSVSLGTPTATDNCGIASTTNDAPASFPVGITTVTWTVTDVGGNTAQCTQTVTVIDNIVPTISCPSNVTVNVDSGACEASSVTLGSPTTGDNCPSETVSNDAPTAFPVGTTTVTWTVTDASGNTAQCTQTVIVTDNIDPTISCPSNVTVNVDFGACTASGVALSSPTTGDNCLGETVYNDAPATFPIGTTTVTWTVTDAVGNTAQCTQNVTVIDNIDPSITCPADIIIDADAGACEATGLALGSASAFDNCTLASVTNDAPTVFPVGTTIVTWTAVDDSGNSSSCSQTIIVEDNEAPTIVCPGDQTLSVSCGLPACGQLATAVDNCSTDLSIAQSPAPGTAITGTTTVTLTVTDSSGNSSSCTFDVSLLDATPPTAVCPGDVTIELGN